MQYQDPEYIQTNVLTNKKLSQHYRDVIKIAKAKLPFYNPKVYSELRNKILLNDVLIIKGETGSGKSVVTPVLLARMFGKSKRMLISEPRTVSIEKPARYIAEQLDVKIGEEVSYQYSGEHLQQPEKTIIHVVTDYFLLKLYKQSPESDDGKGKRQSPVDYNIIIVDEVHERGVNMDLFLAAMKMIFKSYGDTQSNVSNISRKKLILLSATIDEKKFVDYYKSVAKVDVMTVEGRTHSIYNIYLNENETPNQRNTEQINEFIIETVSKLIDNLYLTKHFEECKVNQNCERNTTGIVDSSYGDILVFVPTIKDAKNLQVRMNMYQIAMLRKKYNKVNINQLLADNIKDQKAQLEKNNSADLKASLVYFGKLHRGMSTKDLSFVTGEPKDTYIPIGYTRRVIFSTPIAETGVTVKGVRFVIETGIENSSSYDISKDRKTMNIGYIKKSSVIQRCGRAGRTEPGICIHLYEKDIFDNFTDIVIPNIYKERLHNVLIAMLYDIESVDEMYKFIDNLIEDIDKEAISKALVELERLGIVGVLPGTEDAKHTKKLTLLGKIVSNLGMDYGYAMLIIESFKHNIQKYMIPIVAMLIVNDNPDMYFSIKTNKKVKQFYVNQYGVPITLLKIYIKFSREYLTKHKVILEKNVRKWAENNYLDGGLLYKIYIKIADILKKTRRHIQNKMVDNIADFESISKEIINVFSKIYKDNKLTFINPIRGYILPNGETISKINSFYIDAALHPTIIGYTGIRYVQDKFPKETYIPILSSPFVILTETDTYKIKKE